MSNNTLKARIQHLHRTEEEWVIFEQENPDFIFRAGELIIYDVDQNHNTPRFKFGDGETKLSLLPFASTEVNVDTAQITFDAGRITDYE